MMSLKALLESQSLESYYQPLLDVGVIDNDLPLLIHLNDNELNELLQSINMLPFHSIKMKKAIREMRKNTTNQLMTTTINEENTNNTLSITCNKKEMDQDTIISHAIIYGKNTKRQLTNYEKAINQASMELAFQDTSLLIQKGKLFELAKKKLLNEGYTYKRGKSRSKLSDQINHMKTSSSSINHLHGKSTIKEKLKHPFNSNQPIIKKHQKRSDKAQKQSEQRHECIYQLEIELRQMRESIKNIKSMKSLSTFEKNQRDELIKKKKLTSMEISKLKAQERKHQWYKRKCKKNNLSSIDNKNKESKSILDHLPYSTIILPKSPPISPNNTSNDLLSITTTPLSPSSISSSSSSLSPLPSPSLSISPLSLPTSSHLLSSPSYYHLPPLISKQYHDHQQPYSNFSSIRESDIRRKALTVKDFCI